MRYRSLARTGKVKHLTPKVPKTAKRKAKQGRAKKRKLINRRFNQRTYEIKEAMKYSTTPNKLPVHPIYSYTKFDDGFSYRYIPEPILDPWYAKPKDPHRNHFKLDSYEIQQDRKEIAKQRMEFDFAGDAALVDWGTEVPKVGPSKGGNWRYRKTLKRMNHIQHGVLNIDNFNNLENNMMGVSTRRNHQLEFGRTEIVWKDSYQSVNKPR